MLNTDLGGRVVVDTATLPWQPSPESGVQRRLIERDGGEVARATSVVRYAPGSRFRPHSHGLGEEFLVLDGIFSDEFGDYGPGTYVRNPPGSSHAPFSERGCTIFVKLRHMLAQDSARVVIDTARAHGYPGVAQGLQVLPLHAFREQRTALLRWAPEAEYGAPVHAGGEEILVLDGVLEHPHGRYPAGAWVRSPYGSTHRLFTQQGCTIFVKTGHLPSA